MTTIHCPVIHSGLSIYLTHPTEVTINHCCLRRDFIKTEVNNIWNNPQLLPLRKLNDSEQWDRNCWTCQGNEESGLESFRTGALQKFGIKKNLTGPRRLHLQFDIGCNLACRTCGTHSSTYWQTHLTTHNIPFTPVHPASRADDMIEILKTLDLSNLEMVVFSGGETLLGQGYWKVADAIANLVPNSQEQVTLCFQTNGTQSISERNFKIIEKFQLVKLHISLDGTGKRFEYLRWPASWNQVADNIQNLKQTLPVNVMFLIEETMSVFNLYYHHELEDWAKQNFSVNRLGDVINHTQHVAGGIFSLECLSTEYVDALLNNNLSNLVNSKHQEDPLKIQIMLDEITRFDQTRNQRWQEVFPEVAEFYKRFTSAGK